MVGDLDEDDHENNDNDGDNDNNKRIYLVGAIGLPLRANSLGGMSTQVK